MPSFKVIRASAGSGKTFNLTKEYLRLLFTEQDAFMHILAVTFTNKATEEMKSRIIRELFTLASDQPSKQLPGLQEATFLSEKQIRNKSGNILKKILHHYSGFSVSTIDSFFQRIIRGFTRELGIQEGYSIELDTELVLSEAIEKILIKAEKDKTLLSWLTRFAESLIEKGENWNLRNGIHELGKEIFKESYKSLDEASVKLFSDRSFLNEYRNELFTLHRKIESDYKGFGIRAQSIIASHGLEVDDFNRKSSGAAGFLVKLADGSFREPTATALSAAITEEKWYTANSPKKQIILDIASKELMPLMQQVIEFYNDNHRRFYTSSVILKNLYTLGILIDLSKAADEWCSDNNTFLLSEAPGFLNKIIDGNDTPFIYEKAGCWYHHFMIDEFQDTSLLQWFNFKPLISNSLSQEFDNLAVGDTKQSIYRWRNSNWEILETQINQDFLPGIIHAVTLKENWRSKANLISFNNHFFSNAANLLQQEFDQLHANQNLHTQIDGLGSISALYKDMEQIAGDPQNTGGTVQVEYINKDEEMDFYESANEKVVSVIYELIDKGYHLNDIAILTRKNTEARQIADFLLQRSTNQEDEKYKLDVISDEALRLGSSVTVNTVIALLKYLIDPFDQTNAYFLKSVYLNYILSASADETWINAGGKETDTKNTVLVMPHDFSILAASHQSFSLIELIERIIKIFEFEKHRGEQVYLLALKDMVIDYSRKYSSDVSRFLEFWEETGKDKSVSAPAGQDAVRILTLHKSKGLEFRITIIPYCTWDLVTFNKSFLWCKPVEKPFDKLPVIPLSFTGQLQQTIFFEDYLKEYFRQLVDNLNLLYVAFTRAQDGLFIFCKSRNEDQLKTVSDLTRKITGSSSFMNGELLQNQPTKENELERLANYTTVSLKAANDRIRIAFQGKLLIDASLNKPSRPMNEGKILHEIFNLIKTREDIRNAVNILHLQGKIPAYEQDRYIQFIENAMNDLQIATFFTHEWEVLNEAEIILPNGNIKRPDRVMINGRRTIILDYKFGTRIEPVYEDQVNEYAGLIIEMGYPQVESFLWYVRLGKVIQCKR
jgi:ATP-dependent exoDNAse (exonuclease V) beta subunit